MATRILSLGVILALAGPGAAQERTPPDEAAVLAALDELREQGSYFGMMHGWPCPALLTLLDARELATPRLLEELESLEADVAAGYEPRPDYLEALFYVPGQVKDPRGIEWLEARLDGTASFARQLGGLWLRSWGRLDGPAAAERWWLEGEDRWSGFLRRLASERAKGLDRIQVLEAIDSWFDDEGTRRFFEDQRASEELHPEEVLVVEGFFARRGLEVDVDSLERALAVLLEGGGTAAGRSAVIHATHRLHHEAFVPWLVRMIGGSENAGARVRLSDMSFREEDPGADWAAWWQAHQGETYQSWRKAAFDELEGRFEASPDKAAEHLAKLKYGLVLEPALIGRLTRLARYPEAHGSLRTLVRWREGPPWIEELRALAAAIEAAGGEPVTLILTQDRVAEPRVWLDDLPYPKGP